ncbi:ATP-binding cassette domain-containing protein [Geobacillus stearothermophilus]|uniref:ATP-binding cassette domain-containing protein n=1 Tax=Geobacillus stearothermophilus TaxID=1422 RepID=UPI00399C62D9
MKEGEQWAILRLNGSGKTSLLNIVTGFSTRRAGMLKYWAIGLDRRVCRSCAGTSGLSAARSLINFTTRCKRKQLKMSSSAASLQRLACMMQ